MDIREEAINRMLRIIEQVCRKLKIAICLPFLIKEEKFQNIFDYKLQEFNHIYNVCNHANWRFEYPIDEECSSKDATSQRESQVAESYLEYKKIKLQLRIILMHLSQHEDEIIAIINEITNKISPNCKNIIEHIQLFKQIVEREIRMTPKQSRERKVQLRNAKDLITTTQEEIQKLENDFNEHTLKHNEMVKEFQDEIINLNLVIDEIKNKHNGELDREINSYKTKMCGLKDDTDEKENNLRNQWMAHEAMLEKLMKVNIEEEKLLREERKKAERKFLAARDEYDRDLSKLYELKETLETQLRATNNHYDILKNESNAQNILFINLKEERELAIMQAFAEMLENFKKNRAARVIQRTWRAYHKRISSKKKKRTRRNK